MALGNSFGGGVLLSAGLVHMASVSYASFDEIAEKNAEEDAHDDHDDHGHNDTRRMDEWYPEFDNPTRRREEDSHQDEEGGGHGHDNFPYAGLFLSIGFLITLSVEEVALTILHKMVGDHGHAHEETDKDGNLALPTKPGTNRQRSVSAAMDSYAGASPAGERRASGVQTMQQTWQGGPKAADINLTVQPAAGDSSGHGHSHAEEVDQFISEGVVVALVFMAAVGMHSFLAGLGVGAAKGDDIWGTFIAIICHKSLEAFTLACCFFKSGGSRTLIWTCLFFWCLATPIGIAVGSGLTTSLEAQGVLTGLAGGSFLYVGIIEVISKEMQGDLDKILKVFLLLLGWGGMTLLAKWA